MKITVKRWIADQKRDEMHKYNLDGCFEYVNGYYADTENDTVTFLAAEVIKETEKAVQVALICQTRHNQDYRDPFTVWFPKSQVVNIA